MFAVDYNIKSLLLITRQCHWMLAFNAFIVSHSTAMLYILRWMYDNRSISDFQYHIYVYLYIYIYIYKMLYSYIKYTENLNWPTLGLAALRGHYLQLPHKPNLSLSHFSWTNSLSGLQKSSHLARGTNWFGLLALFSVVSWNTVITEYGTFLKY